MTQQDHIVMEDVREGEPGGTFAGRIAKAIIRRVAGRLTDRPFRLVYSDGTSQLFGCGRPSFEIHLKRWPLPRAVWLTPDPGFGDAYVEGAIDIRPLREFFDTYLARSVKRPSWWQRWRNRLIARTSVSKQYRDIQSHYDRGNAFFALWLDPTRTYSCAYFRHEEESLEEAQRAKIGHVLKKACLSKDQRLLDIGSGWGALIIEAGKRYGVQAHGITLSRQQYDYTRQRIAAEGLAGQVTVELADYRELARAHRRPYDRIVSVGMMEHVGRRNLPRFLSSVRDLLAPGGLCVLHSMTRLHEVPTSPWIRKHVFPGCHVPSWQEVIRLMPRFSFHLMDVESLRRHYAQTLSRWAERFEGRLSAVRQLGFDDRFIRMWRFYLNACAASFRHGALDLHQMVFTRGIQNSLPMTREHVYADDRERAALGG